MKVVLDTNVLFVSVSEYSPYYPIYRALKDKDYELVVTTDIMLEYDEVISNEMGTDVANDLLAFLTHASNVHKINKYYYWNLITSDPDDDKFVDAAVAGNADYIVTNDRHFRVLKKICLPQGYGNFCRRVFESGAEGIAEHLILKASAASGH